MAGPQLSAGVMDDLYLRLHILQTVTQRLLEEQRLEPLRVARDSVCTHGGSRGGVGGSRGGVGGSRGGVGEGRE